MAQPSEQCLDLLTKLAVVIDETVLRVDVIFDEGGTDENLGR